jgi:hypothetical protein
MCKYAWKWKVLSFLYTVISILGTNNITKDEIFEAMKEIENTVNWDTFHNYILIKRKAKKFRDYDVKRVLDKWYAWAYLYHNFPWIQFVWNFDDAMAALKLCFENGLFRKWNLVYTTKKEDTNTEISDFGQKLLDAWLGAKN